MIKYAFFIVFEISRRLKKKWVERITLVTLYILHTPSHGIPHNRIIPHKIVSIVAHTFFKER